MTVLPAAGFRRAKAEITGWLGYAPTPLRLLSGVADQIAIGMLGLKDAYLPTTIPTAATTKARAAAPATAPPNEPDNQQQYDGPDGGIDDRTD
ncbi:MAG: hypothetical protein ABSC06_08330 [Rhodopila sp.]